MSNLEGKFLCNASFDCEIGNCPHKVPHTHIESRSLDDGCDDECHGGTCVPIQVYCRVNGEPIYCVKGLDGKTYMMPKDPISGRPNLDKPKSTHERVRRFLNLEL
jgi:hypothetical protein